MSKVDDRCSPGSHPNADRPNWRPAETIDDYVANCRDGLEQYSDRRGAKIMGVSRAEVWRCRLLAELPQDLWDRLLEMPDCCVPSTTELAYVGQALSGGSEPNVREVERCPHCGEVLRVRGRMSEATRKVVNDWLAEQAGLRR
jgi:hypothetical protein